MPMIRIAERTKELLDKAIEKQIRKEARNPSVLISAIKKGEYGYSYDRFIGMLIKRNKQ